MLKYSQCKLQDMASVLSPLLNLAPIIKVNNGKVRVASIGTLSMRDCTRFRKIGQSTRYSTIKNEESLQTDVLNKDSMNVEAVDSKDDFGVVGVHHVGILCENLERSLHFYQNILGLSINEARPHDKLPYRGAWLWVGSEMIHLMELPNPDPLTERPEHGGRDRHACIAIRDVSKLKGIFDKAGIPYTLSRSGRPAIFTRDPDANALEFTQVD
ncbi:Lactoylglutathione lyase / glyoxalase I family protein [Striga hermonthica]|uniref:Lactoylglutathione lyase / glyoxalase I family protein n=1 Tax=Striga hermonthica TaxID=68872 RepID=A0A9N7N6A3_STRHE|nr:Lactoylglutathione lyase / glyoxalase I family protein [Striga hermonthica]